MVARLSRMIPLLIIFAIAAAVVYVVMARRHSPERAIEAVIKLFTGVTLVCTLFFALVCLYAWFEHNEGVLDLAGGFLIVSGVALVIVRIRRFFFLRKNPAYKSRRSPSSMLDGLRTKR